MNGSPGSMPGGSCKRASLRNVAKWGLLWCITVGAVDVRAEDASPRQRLSLGVVPLAPGLFVCACDFDPHSTTALGVQAGWEYMAARWVAVGIGAAYVAPYDPDRIAVLFHVFRPSLSVRGILKDPNGSSELSLRLEAGPAWLATEEAEHKVQAAGPHVGLSASLGIWPTPQWGLFAEWGPHFVPTDGAAVLTFELGVGVLRAF
jgi:hypothetical protein